MQCLLTVLNLANAQGIFTTPEVLKIASCNSTLYSHFSKESNAWPRTIILKLNYYHAHLIMRIFQRHQQAWQGKMFHIIVHDISCNNLVRLMNMVKSKIYTINFRYNLRSTSYVRLSPIDDGIKHVFSTVKDLNVSRCNVGSTFFRDIQFMSRLESLNVSGCNSIVSNQTTHLLGKMYNLHHLNISECNQLKSSICKNFPPSLTSLNISAWTSFYSIKPGYLPYLQHIKRLFAKGMIINHAFLLTCSRLGNLTHLDLSYGEFKGQTSLLTLSLGECSSLDSLKLSYCRHLSNIGVYYITQIRGLTMLDISGCSNVDKQGLDTLSQTKSLKHLRLNNCRHLTDKDVRILRMLPLVSLYVNNCSHLTVKSLRMFINMSTLHTLDISYCFWNDPFFTYFLHNFQHLRRIYLYDYDFTLEVEAYIRVQLPRCQLFF